MKNQKENSVDVSENGLDFTMDNSVAEAKWLLGMVVFLGFVVLSTGVVASALGA